MTREENRRYLLDTSDTLYQDIEDLKKLKIPLEKRIEQIDKKIEEKEEEIARINVELDEIDEIDNLIRRYME